MQAAIIIAAVAATASAAVAGVSASEQASAQSHMARQQAEQLRIAGDQASTTAASNEAAVIRRGSGELGEQAAAFGQANVGTGGSVADVERQSAGLARLDALNVWYGGELERRQNLNAANLSRYESLIYKRNADTALISGSINAGTKALMGGAAAYGAYTDKLTPGQALSIAGGGYGGG